MLWPFPVPDVPTWAEAVPQLEAWVANTPGASDVSDARAEELFVVGTFLSVLQTKVAVGYLGNIGVRVPPKVQQARTEKLVDWAVRRLWKDNLLWQRMLLQVLMAYNGDLVNQLAETYDESLLMAAAETCLTPYLVCILRRVLKEEHVPDFLQALPPAKRAEYRAIVAGTKVSVLLHDQWLQQRRSQAETPAEIAREARSLQTKVKRQEAETRRLASAKAAEGKAAAQARVAAAAAEEKRQRLAEVASHELTRAENRAAHRRQARADELAERSRYYGDQFAAAAARLAAARADLAVALRELNGPIAIRPLAGRTVSVVGRPERQAEYRMLVETAGARLTETGADLVVVLGAAEPPPGAQAGGARVICSAEEGLIALERALRTEWSQHR